MMNSLNPLCTMKTNKLIAAALLPLLFSCAKENLNQIDKPENGGKYDFTINLIPSDDAVTRAFFSDENGIYWDTAEHSGGIIDKDNNKYKTTGVKIYPWENGDLYKNQASFEFSQTYSGMYKLFYPYDENATYDNIPFWVAPTQYSGVGTSKDIFSLVSVGEVDLTADNHDTGATCEYQIVGSYIKFAVYGKENTQIKSIYVKSENAKIHGNYYVNGNGNLLKGIDYNGDELLIDLLGANCPAGKSKDDAAGIYAAILPTIEGTNGPSKNTYVVATDKGFYKFESNNYREFKFGSIKQINLNLNKATYSATPEYLYIVGGATKVGWNAEKAIELTKVKGENKFKIEKIWLNSGTDDSGFKFLTRWGSWNKVYVNGMNDNKTITYYEDPVKAGNDKKFYVEKSDYYDIIVDFDSNQISCTPTPRPQVYTYPNGSEEKVNMSFTDDTGNVFKTVIYLAKGDKKHDFKVFYNGNYYHINKWEQVDFSIAEKEHKVIYDWSVSADNNDYGWWVIDEYCDKYYEVTFDLPNNKVSLKLAQGSNYWLVGYQFGRDGDNWIKSDNYKKPVVNGVVTWEFEINDGGGFYICGEHDNENYFSTNTDSWWQWNGDEYGKDKDVRFNSKNQSWNLTEGGKYVVTFKPASLTINVTRNNN